MPPGSNDGHPSKPAPPTDALPVRKRKLQGNIVDFNEKEIRDALKAEAAALQKIHVFLRKTIADVKLEHAFLQSMRAIAEQGEAEAVHRTHEYAQLLLGGGSAESGVHSTVQLGQAALHARDHPSEAEVADGDDYGDGSAGEGTCMFGVDTDHLDMLAKLQQANDILRRDGGCGVDCDEDYDEDDGSVGQDDGSDDSGDMQDDRDGSDASSKGGSEDVHSDDAQDDVGTQADGSGSFGQLAGAAIDADVDMPTEGVDDATLQLFKDLDGILSGS